MGIPVKLPVFEGPLELLLHLIDKNKVNIYDIPIVEITAQYMDYIREMELKDLDVMSEFLVMAATLLRIKSQMLLPKEEKKEEEPEDPRQELVRRLLEYKRYRFISLELKDMEQDAEKALFRKKQIPKEIASYREETDVEELLSGLTLAKLHAVFRQVMKRQEDKIDPIRSKFGKIEREEVNLVQKIMSIQQYGVVHRRFSFRALLEAQADKMEVIVTFLGILELMKMGQIEIAQEDLFDDIQISYTADDVKEIDEDKIK